MNIQSLTSTFGVGILTLACQKTPENPRQTPPQDVHTFRNDFSVDFTTPGQEAAALQVVTAGYGAVYRLPSGCDRLPTLDYPGIATDLAALPYSFHRPGDSLPLPSPLSSGCYFYVERTPTDGGFRYHLTNGLLISAERDR